jgi:NADPH2:quinone reductase
VKVVALSEFGHTPELTEIEIPTPRSGELRVQVHAASVNGFDLAVANGYLHGAMEHRFPVVLGKDFAGVIDAIGCDVTGFAVGDRVFGVVTKDFLGDGSFGEYVTVPAAVGVTVLPAAVSFTDAAALGLSGAAAIDAIAAADIQAGSVVLIAGATGGVGLQAVQLAAHAGATVLATASTGEGRALVTEFGAANTVDHTGDLVAQVRAAHPNGVDVALHFAGDATTLLETVKPGGRLVSTLIMSPELLPSESVTVVPVYANPSATALNTLAANQAEGHTAVTVQRVYGLHETPSALIDFAAGKLGKLVIGIR